MRSNQNNMTAPITMRALPDSVTNRRIIVVASRRTVHEHGSEVNMAWAYVRLCVGICGHIKVRACFSVVHLCSIQVAMNASRQLYEAGPDMVRHCNAVRMVVVIGKRLPVCTDVPAAVSPTLPTRHTYPPQRQRGPEMIDSSVL